MILTQLEPDRNLTQIKYDRSKKKWLAINGQETSFPAGPAGKEQAQLYALSCDNPLLYHEIEMIIQNNCHRNEARAIETRTILGALIIQENLVLPPNDPRQVARIQSKSRPRIIHRISANYWQEDHLRCSCEDFFQTEDRIRHGIRWNPEKRRQGAPTLPSGQIYCKHIGSILLSEVLAAKQATMDLEIPF